MPTFNEYLPLIQAGRGSRRAELARAIRADIALEDWHRKTLLIQLEMSSLEAAREAGAEAGPAPGLDVKDVA
jgi:hypothetical protein